MRASMDTRNTAEAGQCARLLLPELPVLPDPFLLTLFSFSARPFSRLLAS
jgi:hypothetical protein